MDLRVTGYGIDAEYTDRTLTITPTSAMGRVALVGHDKGRVPVVLERDDIVRLDYKRATALVNGTLVLRTRDGQKYQLHFKKKTADQFDALHAALEADTPAEQPAPADRAAGADPAVVEQLRQLGDLHAAGVLTDDEFSAKKADLLARM